MRLGWTAVMALLAGGLLGAPLKPNGKASVLFFMATDCPISNFYAPEIQRICREYGPKGVECYRVYVDPRLSAAEVNQHAKDFGYVGVPAIVDTGHALVAKTGVTMTPEVAVAGRNGLILYRGRIDNFYAALGKPRRQATEHDLRSALDAIVSGKTAPNRETKAVGCFIPRLEAYK